VEPCGKSAMAQFGKLLMVRQFSSSSSCSQLIKPPIQIFGLEGRYANALYSAAVKEKKLDQVEKDLIDFQKLLKQDRKLAEFIMNPVLNRALKKEGITSVVQKTGATNLTGNLLVTLVENNRAKNINGVVNAFKAIMSAVRGEVICEVTSAKPLDATQLQELDASLKAFLKKGEVIKLTTKVDPTLIGGLVVSIGDKFIDMSLSTKINKYTTLLTSSV